MDKERNDLTVCGVRETGPHIQARELVPLTILVLVLIGLLWIRTAKLVPSDPAYSLPRDHHMYAFMATHPVGSLHVAPWGWVPVPAGLRSAAARMCHGRFPGARDGRAFTNRPRDVPRRSKAWLRSSARDRRGRPVPLARLRGEVQAYDFWLTDPLAFFFTAAALLCVVLRFDVGFAVCLAIGVLAKESVFSSWAFTTVFGRNARSIRRRS